MDNDMDVIGHYYPFIHQNFRKVVWYLHETLHRNFSKAIPIFRFSKDTPLVAGTDRNKVIPWLRIVIVPQPWMLPYMKSVITLFHNIRHLQSRWLIGGVMTAPYGFYF